MQALTLTAASLLTALALATVISAWLGPGARLWAIRAGQILAGALILGGWVGFFTQSGAGRHLAVLFGLAAVVIGASVLITLSFIDARAGEGEQ